MEKIYFYPTDTVWGIGCNINSEESCLKLHEIKKSNPMKPLSVLFPSIELLHEYIALPVSISVETWALGVSFLIPLENLKREIPTWITRGSEYIGVRLLTNYSIQKIFKVTQAPIISTSLNLSGEPIINEVENVNIFYQNLSENTKKYVEIVNEDKVVSLNGEASTIVQIKKGTNQFIIIRAGRNKKKILEKLGI